MTVDIEQMRRDTRLDPWKIGLQLVAAMGAAFVCGAATLGLILHWLGKL